MRSGTNSIDVKKRNRNRVFRYVNGKDKASMPEIAAALDITPPTVLQIVKELKESEIIEEAGEFKSTGGRKAKAIRTNREARYAVGIDITRNHIGLVLTDLSEKVLKRIRIRKTFSYDDEYFRSLGEVLEGFIEDEEGVKERMTGVGISVPAIVDRRRNLITYSRALKLNGISCEKFTGYIPYPCALVNDANAAALTECVADTRPESMIYLSLSNTVGGAVVFRQKLEGDEQWDPYNSVFDSMYLGGHWHSGEFGHMVIHPGGKRCYCGKEGCLDAYCSALRLAELAEGNLEEFFVEMEAGNGKFRKVWDEYLDDLAIAVDNLNMCFDSEVVLGGYVGSQIAPYIPELKARIRQKNIFEGGGEYIRACRYLREASALGAAIFFMEDFIDAV